MKLDNISQVSDVEMIGGTSVKKVSNRAAGHVGSLFNQFDT